jgi:type I restriction enzyme, S subunit
MNTSLPESWLWTTVEQIGEVTTGFTPPKNQSRFFGGALPFFKPTDLDAGYNVRSFREALTQDGATLGRLLPAGAVLVTCIGATIGKTGLARVACATNQQINAVIVQQECMLPEWLYWWFSSAGGQQNIISNASATTLPIINKSRFAALPVPLAPLAEQTRIVKEIEKHVSIIDAGVTALNRVQANLKRYRAAVLQAACEGRLVPTEAELARTEERDYEPADGLLERLLQHRRALWEQERGNRGYEEPAPPSDLDLPSIPEGWVWVSLEQLSDQRKAITYGVVKLGDPIGDGVPTLRTSNVRHLRLDLREVKRISPIIAAQYQRTRLEGGEVLIAVRGTLGGVVVAPDACAGFNVSREVAVVAPVDRVISPVLAYFIGSPPMQAWLTRNTRGIAYTGINIETLKELPVPLPPLSEQRRIVAEVERRLSIIEETDALITANLKRAERLRQAILKRAFEGKLVPQDPDDEPASVLLERIRAERASQHEGQKGGSAGRGRKGSPQLQLPEFSGEGVHHDTRS